MKKFKRLSALILATLMIAVLFAGCGGGGGDSTTTADPAATTTTFLGFVLPNGYGDTTANIAGTTAGTTVAEEAGYGGVLPADQLDYINYEGPAPIIAEGHDNITMTCGVIVTSNRPCNATDNWLWDFCDAELGITIDAEQVMDKEKQNLLFASNMLPDLMMGFDFSTGDFMKYGHDEKMLLNYAPYMEAGYSPAMLEAYNEDPAMRPNYVVTADGDMYAYPRLTEKNGIYAWYLNYAKWGIMGWVDPASDDPYEGLPTSVSELTERLIELRDVDPATFGTDQTMPISGIYKDGDWGNPMGMVMEAFGYLYRAYFRTWTSAVLFLPSLHQTDDGVETYGIGTNDEYLYEFMAIQNDWYNENLFPVDYFTADSAQHTAWNASGYWGVQASGEGSWQWKTPGWDYPEQINAPVLKSSVRQITPYSANYPVYGTTSYVTSAATEYPEAAVRFWDLFWHREYEQLMRGNPIEGIHETYGRLGMIWGDNPIDDEQNVHNIGFYFPSDNPDYYYNEMCPTYMGNCRNGWDLGYYAELSKQFQENADEADPLEGLVGYEKLIKSAEINYERIKENYENGTSTLKDLNCAELKWTIANYANRGAYCGRGFEQPLRYVYRNQEVTDKIADYTAVLNPYILEQGALFITGRRSLDEIAAFQEEINGMGLLEYEEILVGEYEAFKQAFGMDNYLPAPSEIQ